MTMRNWGPVKGQENHVPVCSLNVLKIKKSSSFGKSNNKELSYE